MDERRDSGASAVEYALLVAAIAAVVVFILVLFGGVVTELFQKSCDNVQAEADTSQTC